MYFYCFANVETVTFLSVGCHLFPDYLPVYRSVSVANLLFSFQFAFVCG